MDILSKRAEVIPTGEGKTDIKAREEIITLFYLEWRRNNTEGRVFNEDLKDYFT